MALGLSKVAANLVEVLRIGLGLQTVFATNVKHFLCFCIGHFHRCRVIGKRLAGHWTNRLNGDSQTLSTLFGLSFFGSSPKTNPTKAIDAATAKNLVTLLIILLPLTADMKQKHIPYSPFSILHSPFSISLPTTSSIQPIDSLRQYR